jgi:hypothetical protein
MPVPFRPGGASLSGPAVSSDLLVEAREALDAGTPVRVQPGATRATDRD